ncbi:PHP domain-containing protein [bacterium]|nr:PHP domain-containing protein [bacterium]
MKTKLQKADLHLHTNLADGFSSPQEMVLTAQRKKIKFIAITDHNQILAAVIARRFARQHHLDVVVVVGEEIDTKEGEIIGLFLKKRIPKLMDVESTCKMIKKQGGLVCIPHPFRIIFGKGLNLETIKKLKQKKLVDLIEIANFWDYPGLQEKRKHLLNGTLNLPRLANSDSHSSKTLGEYFNWVNANSEEELKKALLTGQVTPVSPPIKASFKTKIFLHHAFSRLWQKIKRETFFPNKVSNRKKLANLLNYHQPFFSPAKRKLPDIPLPRRLLKH